MGRVGVELVSALLYFQGRFLSLCILDAARSIRLSGEDTDNSSEIDYAIARN